MPSKKFLLIAFVFALSGIAGFILSLTMRCHRFYDDGVQTIQTFHYPATFVKQLKNDPRAGEKIFKEFCSACHSKKPTIDIHAPRLGDKQAWQVRKKHGMNTMLALTIQGFGAMPSRGGCFECSDKQLEEAINYIINRP